MQKFDVGCYYFPNYHRCDERNTAAHGANWSEWELVKAARPRFPGHHQPKVPLWGCCDESDPAVMKQKILAARTHGIDYFIFDYYHYADGPFLSHCLDDGFLPAVTGDSFRFALMWANHDWIDIHPRKRSTPPALLYPGAGRQSGTVPADHRLDHRTLLQTPELLSPGREALFLHLPPAGADPRSRRIPGDPGRPERFPETGGQIRSSGPPSQCDRLGFSGASRRGGGPSPRRGRSGSRI